MTALAPVSAALDSVRLLVAATNFFSFGGAKRSLAQLGITEWEADRNFKGDALFASLRLNMRGTLIEGRLAMYATRENDSSLQLIGVPDAYKRLLPVRVYGTTRIFARGDFNELRGGGEVFFPINNGEVRCQGLVILFFAP